jgi:uncharacterized protein (DUF2235 family)
VDPSPSALASLIHVYGLLCAGNQEAIPYILQMYSKASCEAKHQKKTFPPNEAFKWRFSHANQIRIKFCGLWDTVSSYGWIYDPIQQPFLGCNPIIDIGRHAVSIHERHCFYKDNLWGTPDPTQDFRQVWFSGTHSDIGGSYPEKTSGLSKIAFEWMLVEAAKAGLRIDEARARVILGKATPLKDYRSLPHRTRMPVCIIRSTAPGGSRSFSPSKIRTCTASACIFPWDANEPSPKILTSIKA